MIDNPETNPKPPPFDATAFPEDTCFYERRSGQDRRRAWSGRADTSGPDRPARRKPERRRRVDPTTFDKQYAADELEFMNAMQQFKVQSCKAFPSYAEVLAVARRLGYRKPSSSDSEVRLALDYP